MLKEYKGYTIEIKHDEDSESPREWDNLGTFKMYHRMYDYSDKNAIDFLALPKNEKKNYISLTVFMLDHSGLSFSTKPFNCPWDSGVVGVIFVSKEKARKEFQVGRLTKKIIESVINNLKSEIETLDQYAQGDIYGYVIKDQASEEVDSCWGHYGSENCEKEAMLVIDHMVNKEKVA